MSEQFILPITEVSLELYSKMVGFSKATLEARINRQQWVEGIEYVRNPAGKIVVNIPAAQAWERKAWQEKAESAAPSRQTVASSSLNSGGDIRRTPSRSTGGLSARITRTPRKTMSFSTSA